MAYVSNINGYDIKDKEAREQIEELVNYQPPQRTITPIYMGDYLSGIQTSAAVQVGDEMYCVSASSYDDYGYIRKYNLTTNMLIYEKRIRVGHANSMCYVPSQNAFYIAPMYVYTNGERVVTTNIYRYTNDFEILKFRTNLS